MRGRGNRRDAAGAGFDSDCLCRAVFTCEGRALVRHDGEGRARKRLAVLIVLHQLRLNRRVGGGDSCDAVLHAKRVACRDGVDKRQRAVGVHGERQGSQNLIARGRDGLRQLVGVARDERCGGNLRDAVSVGFDSDGLGGICIREGRARGRRKREGAVCERVALKVSLYHLDLDGGIGNGDGGDVVDHLNLIG